MAIGDAIFHSHFAAFATLAAGIFGLIKVGEQEQEHCTVQTNPDHEVFWVVAFAEQQLELMAEDENELHHLECGQMLLPPNVFLVFRAHCGDHVIEIHDNVHE